MWVVSKTILAR